MKKFSHTGLIILVATLMLSAILYASYNNYMSIQANVIQIEQNQLLTLVETVAHSIERYFINHQRDLEIISKNSIFTQDYQAYTEGLISDNPWQQLEDYYYINNQQLDNVGIVDLDGESIFAAPYALDASLITQDIAMLKINPKNTVGDIYKDRGELFVNILKPINIEDEQGAVLYMRVRLLTIYDQLVAPVRAGDKGYASVKDAEGVIIMHPNASDIGQNVIEVRTTQYPDFDWSELKGLVEKQKRGESGVGVYHSLWFTEDAETRVKKFNAYTPAKVGESFWIVNISKDYLDVVTFLKERTYSIVIINFAIIILFVMSLLIYFRMNNDRKALKIQKKLSEEVVDLNSALEEDIEARKKLEGELIKSKEWYENIFESGSDCMFITSIDAEGFPERILDVNQKVLESLGYEKNTLLKMCYRDIGLHLISYIEKKEWLKMNGQESVMLEDLLYKQDGGSIPVEINIKKFDRGDESQYIMVSRDLTEKKLQEATLKRSEERFRDIVQQVADRVVDFEDTEKDVVIIQDDKVRFASELENINIKLEKLFKEEVLENQRKEALMIYQARLAAMGEMIGSIAHQWRQPLSVMHMLFNNVIDAYKHGELDETLLTKQHERMLKLTKHMSETIDDFRYFFNPNSEESNFLVSSTVDKTLALLDDMLKQHSIEVSFKKKSDVLLEGYENQLSQVLLSVVQNSIEALIQKENQSKEIDIILEIKESKVIIQIEDNAEGVDEELLDQLFEAHFSTKKKQHGTGLGLYISRVIIEKNFSGHIHVTNGEKGLLTSIQIPMKEV